MGLFRRKRVEADLEADRDGPAAPGGQGAGADDVATDEPDAPASAPGRPRGPWDEADAPEDGVQRLDLGGLRVPLPPQTEVRVEVGPQGQVVAATLVREQSAMQLSAFAAPRTEGIWAEVREEIATSLREGGGRADEDGGPHGVELHAQVPTEVPGRGRMLAPARFVGVDGPRWFLRAMLTGPAATDATAAAALESALRDVVVVRGGDPMAVRDPLPLRLPKDVQEAAERHQAGAQPQPGGQQQPGGQPGTGGQPRPAPAVPERGPEITEIR